MYRKKTRALPLLAFAFAAACSGSAREGKPSETGVAEESGKTKSVGKTRPAARQPENYALWLDGKDDFLKTDKWLSGSPAGFCLEAWVKPASVNPYWDHVSLLAHRAAGNDKFLRYLRPKHSFIFASALPNRKSFVVRSERKANKNGWFHVALVCDGSSVTLYLDGDEADRTSTTVAPDWDAGYAASFIGGDPFPGAPVRGGLRGQIDDVRIWSKPRSADEIRSTMKKAPPPDAPGLAAYWNFDEGDGQVARDVTGHGHDAQLGSTPAVDQNDPLWIRSGCPAALKTLPAVPSHVLWFDGTGTHIRTLPIGGLGPGSNAATIEAWVRPDSPLKPGCLVAFESAPQKRDFRLALGEGGTVDVSINTAQGTRTFQTAPAVRARTWHHVAVVCDAGALAIALDGKAILKETLGQAAAWSGQPLLVGAATRGAEPFFGEIDEVRVWNTARSAAQIEADRGRALSGSEPGLIGYWPFDEGRGQAALDRTSAGAHGRLGDVVLPDARDPVWLASDRPRGAARNPGTPARAQSEGGALRFDGRDDYVEVGNTAELRLKGPITVEAWIKADLATFDRPILSKQNIAGKQNAYELLIRNGKPIFRVSDGVSECCGDQGWWPAVGKNDVGVNEWHHIAGVYDRKNVAVYVDGVLEASVPFDKALFDVPFSVKIGTNALVQSRLRKRTFQGLIDEVRLWSIARKQEDILVSMNAGLRGDEEGLIGYWTFDEIDATSAPVTFQPVVVDESAYQNHGFLGGKTESTPAAPQRVVSDAPVVPASAM